MNSVDITPDKQGKVRDIYDLGDSLLFVATDRISAFDYILEDEIPFKGEVLTRISEFWFKRMEDIIQNHVISTDIDDLPENFKQYADYLSGRFMIVKKAEPFPIECIVRGYLTGSGKKEYDREGTVCGIKLPEGLVEASKIEEPIFTPSTKAEIGEHDENISFDKMVDIIGKDDAEALKRISLEIYERGSTYARERGIIIADTKLEFGKIGDTIIVIDEILTPDSSRFWPEKCYQEGVSQPSFDKQIVRDWLKENWDGKGEPPRLPQEVIEETSKKYREAFEIITGESFEHKER